MSSLNGSKIKSAGKSIKSVAYLMILQVFVCLLGGIFLSKSPVTDYVTIYYSVAISVTLLSFFVFACILQAGSNLEECDSQ